MKQDWIKEALEARAAKGQKRTLRTMDCRQHPYVEVGGRRLVNFSSNDYLGLASHPLLAERGEAFAKAYGAGSRASRLVCGSHPGYPGVEAKLARLKGTEAALVLNSGWQANLGLLSALAGPKDLVLMDKLVHNSLIQGVLASGAPFKRFRHNDLDHLAQLLEGAKGNRVFVVAETVYSMDGDQPDLERLVGLTREAGAFLILDEAHSTGVFGPQGMGLSVGLGADLVMGTFGKALGSFGAYLAGSELLIQYLINFHPGLIYSTALPPFTLGAIDASLELVPKMGAERKHLTHLSQILRQGLRQRGYDTLASQSQIVPLLVGEEAKCLALSAYLEDQGYLAMAIRPPTVEPGKARLRLALSAAHTKAQIEGLLSALDRWEAS